MNDLHNIKDSEIDGIMQALERPPEIAVPNDFAARVMARVPQQPRRRYVLRQALQTEARLGRKLAFVAMLILVAGMILLAPHTSASETWLLLQGVLFAQLVALLLWLGISYKRLL